MISELFYPSLNFVSLWSGVNATSMLPSLKNSILSKLLIFEWYINNNHGVAIEESRMKMSLMDSPKALAVFTHSLDNVCKFIIQLYVELAMLFLCVLYRLLWHLRTGVPLTLAFHNMVNIPLQTPIGCDFITFSSLLFQSWREVFYWSLFTGEWGTLHYLQWGKNRNLLYLRKFTWLKHLQFEGLRKSEKEVLGKKKSLQWWVLK